MAIKIAILGEAWGEKEAQECAPFVGPSGFQLTKMLEDAEIARADCFLTNVFNLHPPANRIEAFCGEKKESIKGYPALIKGKYIHARYQPELDRLAAELIEVNPNLIIAMGNTACWAMLGKTFISKLRGTTSISSHTVEGFKILPTYHPAAVLRQWELRPTTVMDLMKAKRESEYSEIRRPKREIWIEPTLEDIDEFNQKHIQGCTILSVDIETSGNQITCIGFAPNREIAIVIPIRDSRTRSHSFWPDERTEREAWYRIRNILQDRRIPKLFQNGLYDIAFIWRSTGIKVYGASEDTMLLSHALQPESLKSLGYLGSLFTDEGSWKQMREKVQTIKKDD